MSAIGPARVEASASADATASTMPQLRRSKLPPIVKAHDIFNLVSIALLNVLNLYYLSTGNGFILFYCATMIYFLADITFVGIVPQCVKSPVVILAHHIVSALYILIPYNYPKYEWCMSYCMLVEINTWILIAKRTVPWKGFDILFYFSWVLLRNIWYPYLIYVFFLEWQHETASCGSPWNAILVTPIFQTALTGLNYFWTVQLLLKRTSKKQHQL